MALIEAQRTHSRLLDDLERLRLLWQRGLVYREGIHSDRQFVEAYLAHQKSKIDKTLGQLEENRRQALLLIRLAEGHEKAAAESASSSFSARVRHRRRSVLAEQAGSDRSRIRASL